MVAVPTILCLIRINYVSSSGDMYLIRIITMVAVSMILYLIIRINYGSSSDDTVFNPFYIW